jgi:hypothetical protein
MPIPDEIFPQDKLDPTVSPQDMSVERTLGVMSHVKAMTSKRRTGPQWRYQVIEPRPDHEDDESQPHTIRRTYGLPDTAFVANRGTEWAVWTGAGKPETDPFETFEEPPAPAPDALLAAVLASAPEGTGATTAAPQGTLSPAAKKEADERMAAYESARLARLGAALQPSMDKWSYWTEGELTASALRTHFETRGDAPFILHPGGDIAAVWRGKGEPTRQAFPDPIKFEPATTPKEPAPMPFQGIRQIEGDLDGYVGPAPEPVKVFKHAPSAALNEMGVKLYGLSQEPLYAEGFRKFLLQVSDALHAEAAKIELAKMRERMSRK